MITFRVDSSTIIGSGHLMRCLNLAEKDSIFICKDLPGSIISKIEDKKIKVVKLDPDIEEDEDFDKTLEIMNINNSKVIIIDSYAFRESYFKKFGQNGKKVVVIDDLADRKLPVEIIINQNIYANKEMYKGRVLPETKLLLGPEYAMLRDEFLEFRSRYKVSEEINDVVVTLGGSDPDNITEKIVEYLKDEDYKLHIVLGKGNLCYDRIKSIIAGYDNIKLYIDVAKMSELMMRSDIVICAGGTTVLEVMFLGIPFIVGKLVENQRFVVRYIDRNELGLVLGDYKELSKELLLEKINDFNYIERKISSEKGKTIIDGRGKYRIMDAIKDLG